MRSLKNKKEKEIDIDSIKEKIENFLYSDKPTATATKFLLMFLAMGGIAVGGAIIPGIIKALKELNLENDEGEKVKFTKKEFKNALNNLKRQKFIKIINEKSGNFKIKLTNKGKKRVYKISLEKVAIRRPKKWDKKWRIVIFDVPTEYNSAREALRKKMKEFGFKQLQKSVWIHPFECEDEILFVAEVFGVEKYVEIITAEKMLHDREIKNYFKEYF